MQTRIGTRRIAVASIFATLYALLSLVPVSHLIGINSFLSMAEVFSPLAGMVLGPAVGGLSVLVGTFVAIALGKPIAFNGLDFIPGVVAAVTAGFAIRGRLKEVASLSLILIVAYLVDPLSAPVVRVNSIPIPFVWMHVVSIGVFLSLSVFTGAGKRSAFVSQAVLTVSIVFVATMNAHVAGAIMFENVLVRMDHALTASGIMANWVLIFYAYPVERIFFTIVGSLLAIPVLRAIPPQVMRQLAGGERTSWPQGPQKRDLRR